MRAICLSLLLLFAACGCEKKAIALTSARTSASAKPIVLVSVPSYLYFVERIGGDTVTPLSLAPAGANPHIYEPTPKEVEKFRQASLWFRLGDPSEQKTYTVLKEQSKALCIIDITEGISLLPACGHHHHDHGHHHHDEDTRDLHIWLSPKLAQSQAKTIARHLSDLLPENRASYDRALTLLLKELEDLDAEIASRLAPKSGSCVLVSHPAFAYFCQDYHLDQLSIEVEGKEPLPQDITALLIQARKHKIAQVIAEPQYSDKGAKLIAECLQVPVCVIDPYSQDYMNNLRLLAEAVAQS
jgi:zinc transport system substrate-binding protein